MLVNIRISAHSYLFRICSNCSVKFFNNLSWWAPCAENCNPLFFAIFGWKLHKRHVNGKRNCMTTYYYYRYQWLKQVNFNNDLPWWISCAKNINFLVFCHYFDENHMKKEIVLLLRPMTKASQLNDISGNSMEDVSDMYSVKWPFKVSAWRCRYMTCAYLLELPFFMQNCVQFESRQVKVKF